MSRLQTKVPECKHREPNRLLREQFIGGLNNVGITHYMLREITALEKDEKAIREHVLGWVCRLEIQRV